MVLKSLDMIREEVDRLDILQCIILGQKLSVDYPSTRLAHRLEYIRERLAARLHITNDDVKKILKVDVEARKTAARNADLIAKGVEAIKNSLSFMTSVLSTIKGITNGVLSYLMNPPPRSPVQL